MAAKDFPASPVAGQVFENWVWNATNESWDSLYNGTPPAMLQVSKYADASARTTAIPTPAEGMITYLDDINQFQGYQGASWRGVGGLVPIVPPTVNYSGGTATGNTLGTISFTGVTSISLNNVFSSAYNNYRIVISQLRCNTADVAIKLRLRSSGTDYSGVQYYFMGARYSGTAAPVSYSILNTTYVELGIMPSSGTDTYGMASIDITNPFLAQMKGYTGGGVGYYTSTTGFSLNGLVGDATSRDGFTLLTGGSATMNGVVTVYGYNS